VKHRIVAFGHQKRVGKDQFVKFLIDILRPQTGRAQIVRRGFADKLYDICHQLYGWAGFQNRAYYTLHPEEREWLLPDLGKTPRAILIEVGNHMRKYDPLVWLNATLRGMDYDLLLITDLRYPNEFTNVKALGGLCCRITRPGLPEPTDQADTALNGYPGWDITIENNNDLGMLYKLAETFAQEYIL
jgi:hypothetical protein